MTTLATDDPARRVPFIWLGPEDFEAPFEARGQAWMAGLVLIPTGWVMTWLLTPMFLVNAVVQGWLGVLVHLLIALIVGTVVAILVVRGVGKHVTPTTPLRHHLAMVQQELDAPRPTGVVMHRRSVPADLFIESRPENHRTHMRTVDSAIAQWESP